MCLQFEKNFKKLLKNYTKPFSKQTEILQRNFLDLLQYLQMEMIEINPVTKDIQGTQLEESLSPRSTQPFILPRSIK